MNLLAEFDREELAATGRELYALANELYPICRSITGDGLRRTLAEIERRIPLQLHEVPSGTQVFDWMVPKEWNIRDAYIADNHGNRIVDFLQNNLHVMNYSVPVHATMSLEELKPHLFTLPEYPGWVPYRTTYYKEQWGFCLSHNQMLALLEGEYEVCIDSTLRDGHLTYGEYYLAGEESDEVLISCHVCHPSLANDNLSGLTIATRLSEFLSRLPVRYSYRFLFIPGTIGAITWLARNKRTAQRIQHGLVLTCLGDSGSLHYKKSRRESAEIDRAATLILKQESSSNEVLEFSPYGYDERQYCSPGFNLPVGCLMRSVWGTFPEYHTSADNMTFLQPGKLAESLRSCVAILDVLEGNRSYRSLNPYCEPQLGRRNLYGSVGGHGIADEINARLWVLNLSDGEHSLLDIAERSRLPFGLIRDAAELLRTAGLLAEVSNGAREPDQLHHKAAHALESEAF